MTSPKPFDVTELIDRNRMSRFQVNIIVLCFLIVAIDGFDTAAIGFIAPAIRAQWGITAAQLAPIFGAGLAGLTAGALIIGPLADRVGRKRVLLFCIIGFSIASIASAWTNSPSELLALRFLTGLGLGAAMPNAITLTSEFCPSARRSFLVTVMFCGFTLGSASGGFVAAILLKYFSWRTVLLGGGAIPLLLSPALAWLLPESVRYLVLTGRHRRQIVQILSRIAPREDFESVLFTTSQASQLSGFPVMRLFRANFVLGTLLLWLTFFMSLCVLYLLSNWLPTLLHTTGASLQTAVLVTAMFQVGGTVGAIALGWIMDQANPYFVLAAAYGAAGGFIALIGELATTPWLAAIAIFCAGFCVSGAQVGANALSAAFYPTDCRATGVSWANGIGRIGSVLGSTLGGIMLTRGLTMSAIFLLIGLPAVIAAASILTLGLHRSKDKATHISLDSAGGNPITKN